MKPLMWVGILVVTTGVIVSGCTATRAGYATAPFTMVRTDGKFEIRDYPTLRLAETSKGEGENGGFSRLFKFISGNNQANEKIAMTTPVFMGRTGNSGSGSMSFVLPKELSTPPAPSQTNVWLTEVPAGRFATHRFSAPRSDSAIESKAEGKLQAWIAQQGLTAKGEPVFAYYDPPWIPRWFRRNEVLLRLAE